MERLKFETVYTRNSANNIQFFENKYYDECTVLSNSWGFETWNLMKSCNLKGVLICIFRFDPVPVEPYQNGSHKFVTPKCKDEQSAAGGHVDPTRASIRYYKCVHTYLEIQPIDLGV